MFFHYQRLKSLLLFSVIKVLFTSSKRTSSFDSLFQALSQWKGVKLPANDERRMCLSGKQPNPTASRFDNITKELINAIGENSTPKSTKDATKFGEQNFLHLQNGFNNKTKLQKSLS